MNIEQLIQDLSLGKSIEAGSEAHRLLLQASQEAMRVTAELNSAWHPPDKVRELMARLTGRPVDETFTLFPPFYTDFGKNIAIGKNVFINACCCFQDQGGISLGDGCLIGHRVTLATINHGLEPANRHANYPRPIILGKNVWLGAGAIVLPGVSIGDNAVVAAGAVVSRDVERDAVVAGVPARFVKSI